MITRCAIVSSVMEFRQTQTPRTLRTVAAFVLTVWFSIPFGSDLAAQEADMGALLDRLREATPETYRVIEKEVELEWGKSGSPAMDMLLQRGRDALEAGKFSLAVEHFTGLIDHAPKFAEGHYGRASAFFNLERMGPALDDLRQTLVLNPDHYGAMTGLGVLFVEFGDDASALEAFRAAQAIHPQKPDVIEAIARLEQRLQGQDI
jgi:tetratricopeptide (TPR) repeat protein